MEADRRLGRLLASHQGGCETELLAQALVAFAVADIPREQWATPVPDPDIARVLSFMHERFAAPVDNAALSAVAGISGNTFLRRFRQMTGTTPHRYLCRLRADSAAIDLRTTSQSIKSIALRNGFCDRFHFSRVFQKAYGVSPAAYRSVG